LAGERDIRERGFAPSQIFSPIFREKAYGASKRGETHLFIFPLSAGLSSEQNKS
jgi:hypothetical protein